jgi:predicted Zn finger-like uncharacterized protein
VNVTCEKCNKRYSIADDKVRGKSVKIRCKQCQNLISVQGPPVAGQGAVAAVAITAAAPQAQAWEDERTRAMPAMDLSPTWFAMVKGKQIGPMTLRDLESKVKTQEVSLRTYLWKQGMADWKRASDVPEVSPVFAGVSVGASATGPTRAAGPTGKPISKSTASVARDVATANEVPSPEITRGPKITASKTNGNGHGVIDDDRDARTLVAQPFPTLPERPQPAPKPLSGNKSAVARPIESPKPAPEPAPTIPAELPRSKTSQMGKVELKSEPSLGLMDEPSPHQSRTEDHAPLNDLFSDLPVSGQHAKLDEPPDTSTDPNQDMGDVAPGASADAGDGGDEAKADPFAALGEVQPGDLPPPGEATKFFIAQAGVNKRNPPWKIALFVVLGLGLPVGLLFLLSTLHVVPPVLVQNEKGEMVEQSFFSPQGLSVGIKDLLSGEAKRKRAEAERQKAEAEAAAKAKAAQQGIRREKGEPADPSAIGARREEKPKYTQEELAKLYGTGGPANSDVSLGAKNDVGPKVRQIEASAPVVEKGGGLDAEAVQKVMAERMKAFTGCVEEALKKNPNVKLEKTVVVLDVATSGAVKSVTLQPHRLELTDWGGCIRDKAKRIVFPSADGESQIEIPLLLGAQVN